MTEMRIDTFVVDNDTPEPSSQGAAAAATSAATSASSSSSSSPQQPQHPPRRSSGRHRTVAVPLNITHQDCLSDRLIKKLTEEVMSDSKKPAASSKAAAASSSPLSTPERPKKRQKIETDIKTDTNVAISSQKGNQSDDDVKMDDCEEDEDDSPRDIAPIKSTAVSIEPVSAAASSNLNERMDESDTESEFDMDDDEDEPLFLGSTTTAAASSSFAAAASSSSIASSSSFTCLHCSETFEHMHPMHMLRHVSLCVQLTPEERIEKSKKRQQNRDSEGRRKIARGRPEDEISDDEEDREAESKAIASHICIYCNETFEWMAPYTLKSHSFRCALRTTKKRRAHSRNIKDEHAIKQGGNDEALAAINSSAPSSRTCTHCSKTYVWLRPKHFTQHQMKCADQTPEEREEKFNKNKRIYKLKWRRFQIAKENENEEKVVLEEIEEEMVNTELLRAKYSSRICPHCSELYAWMDEHGFQRHTTLCAKRTSEERIESVKACKSSYKAELKKFLMKVRGLNVEEEEEEEDEEAGNKAAAHTCIHCNETFPWIDPYRLSVHSTACAKRTPKKRRDRTMTMKVKHAIRERKDDEALIALTSAVPSSRTCTHCSKTYSWMNHTGFMHHQSRCSKLTPEEREAKFKARIEEYKLLMMNFLSGTEEKDENTGIEAELENTELLREKYSSFICPHCSGLYAWMNKTRFKRHKTQCSKKTPEERVESAKTSNRWTLMKQFLAHEKERGEEEEEESKEDKEEADHSRTCSFCSHNYAWFNQSGFTNHQNHCAKLTPEERIARFDRYETQYAKQLRQFKEQKKKKLSALQHVDEEKEEVGEQGEHEEAEAEENDAENEDEEEAEAEEEESESSQPLAAASNPTSTDSSASRTCIHCNETYAWMPLSNFTLHSDRCAKMTPERRRIHARTIKAKRASKDGGNDDASRTSSAPSSRTCSHCSRTYVWMNKQSFRQHENQCAKLTSEERIKRFNKNKARYLTKFRKFKQKVVGTKEIKVESEVEVKEEDDSSRICSLCSHAYVWMSKSGFSNHQVGCAKLTPEGRIARFNTNEVRYVRQLRNFQEEKEKCQGKRKVKALQRANEEKDEEEEKEEDEEQEDEEENESTAAATSSSSTSHTCSHCLKTFAWMSNMSLRRHESYCASKTPKQRVSIAKRIKREHTSMLRKERAGKEDEDEKEKKDEESESDQPAAAASSTSRKQATSSSKKSSTVTPKKRRRRSSTSGISMSTGLVKRTSHKNVFPLEHDAIMAKVGYNLPRDDENEDEDDKLVYEVEAIRGRRFNRELVQYEYLLKWKGWPEEENTWQLASDTRCPELIQHYHIADEEKLQIEIDDAVEIASSDPPCVAFHRDGLCSLTSSKYSLTRAQVNTTEEFVTKLFNSTMLSISHRDQLDLLREKGFDRLKLRQHERYDLTLNPSDLPFLPTAPWLPIVRQILGGNAYLKHAGCMLSLPTSETQKWHSDGDHRDESTHLPCWMLNVFVPLIDMTKALGGTEFFPGSHILFDEYIRTTPITPLLKAGQCLIFDYRIRHRGLGNRSTTPRPVLYFSYAGSESLVDEKNFSRGRYAVLPPPVNGMGETREERLKKRKRKKGESDEEDEKESETKDEGGKEENDTEQREEIKESPRPKSKSKSSAHSIIDMNLEEELKDEKEEKKSSSRKFAAATSSSYANERKQQSRSFSPDLSLAAAAASSSAAASSYRDAISLMGESMATLSFNSFSIRIVTSSSSPPISCVLAIDLVRILMPDSSKQWERVFSAPLIHSRDYCYITQPNKLKQNWAFTVSGVQRFVKREEEKKNTKLGTKLEVWMKKTLIPAMQTAATSSTPSSSSPAPSSFPPVRVTSPVMTTPEATPPPSRTPVPSCTTEHKSAVNPHRRQLVVSPLPVFFPADHPIAMDLD